MQLPNASLITALTLACRSTPYSSATFGTDPRNTLVAHGSSIRSALRVKLRMLARSLGPETTTSHLGTTITTTLLSSPYQSSGLLRFREIRPTGRMVSLRIKTPYASCAASSLGTAYSSTSDSPIVRATPQRGLL